MRLRGGGGKKGKGTGEFVGNRSITEIEKERRIEYQRERERIELPLSSENERIMVFKLSLNAT